MEHPETREAHSSKDAKGARPDGYTESSHGFWGKLKDDWDDKLVERFVELNPNYLEEESGIIHFWLHVKCLNSKKEPKTPLPVMVVSMTRKTVRISFFAGRIMQDFFCFT